MSNKKSGIFIDIVNWFKQYFHCRTEKYPSPKPVLKRLLLPVSILFLILITSAGILFWQAQQQLLIEGISHINSEIVKDLYRNINQQIYGLTMNLKPIVNDANVKSALSERNAGLLSDKWKSLFNEMNTENMITHFYFLDANRVCLLRLHSPEKNGDIINRFTAIEAERTGNTSSGIELGPLGTFTLRVVQPVYDDGKIIGYVELGKEIEDILTHLHTHSDIEVALIIRKEFLTRQSWEEGMKLLGRESEWDRFSESVISFSSQTRLPDEFMSLVDHSRTGENFHEAADIIITADMKQWHVTLSPMYDVSGKEVGDFMVLHDITIILQDFTRRLSFVGITSGVLLILLFLFTYVILRRTDMSIRAQQAELESSEAYLAATLKSIGDGVIGTDTAGQVTNLNLKAEALTGWNQMEATGMHVSKIFKIINTYTRKVVENPIELALKKQIPIELANHTSLIALDGREFQIADSCAPIRDQAGQVIGAVLVFRDVSREYETREQLNRSNQRMTIAADSAGIGFWELEIDKKNLIWDKWMYILYGVSINEAIQINIFDLWQKSIHPDDVLRVNEQLNLSINEGRDFDMDFRILKPDEEIRYLKSSAVVVRDNNNNIIRLTGINYDITDSKLVEKNLTHKATHDLLTGMLNRQAILDQLEMELSRARRKGSTLSAAICDIDHFKIINDTYGHQTGDEVLSQLSLLIRNCLRDYDWVGRLGGEEFMVIITGKADEDKSSCFERLRIHIANSKIETRSGSLSITFSIGVASEKSGTTADEIFAAADKALYCAKRDGRNRVVYG